MEIVDVKTLWEKMNEQDGVKFEEKDFAAWEDDWDDDCCCCAGGYSK